MKEKIENNGITLIALVVTIIILLILAGITISQLTGNGIFEKTKEAKEKYKIAKQDEEKKLNEYTDQINLYNTRNEDDLTPKLLWTNSNPNANFEPQKVNLDLSEFNFVIVVTYEVDDSDECFKRCSGLFRVTDSRILL